MGKTTQYSFPLRQTAFIFMSLGAVMGLPASVSWAQEAADKQPRHGPTGSDGGAHDTDAGAPGDEPQTTEQNAASDSVDIEVRSAPWSQGIPLEQRRLARDIAIEADDLARKRYFATAAVKYEEAIALWPHPAFYFNLAVVQLNQQLPIQAHASIEKAMEHGPEPLGPENYETAGQYRELTRTKVARAQISCTEPGARVTLDGNPIINCPGEYKLVTTPGSYFIEATKKGFETVSRQIVLSPGREPKVTLVMRFWNKERRWKPWKPWAVAGGATAALLAAGYLQLWSRANHIEFDHLYGQICPIGCLPEENPENPEIPVMPKELSDKLTSVRRQWIGAQILYGVGGAALVTGAVLLYMNREYSVLQTPAEAAAINTVSVTPFMTRDALGLGAAWSF